VSKLVEVYDGLWISELYAVWFVDGKTWLLLEGGKNHWVPGDYVTDIVAKWEMALRPWSFQHDDLCTKGRPLQQHTSKCEPGCNYGGYGS